MNSREQLRNEWRSAGFLAETTVGEALRAGAARYPKSRIEWISKDRPASATVADLHTHSLRFAAGLTKLGLKPGDVVACQLPNWMETAIATQAVFLCGFVLLPIVHIYGPSELRHILGESRARALIIPDRWHKTSYLQRVEEVGPLPDLEHVIVVGNGERHSHLSWDRIASAEPQEVHFEGEVEDRCSIIYTSGTSSKSKGVSHSHRSLLAAARVNFELCSVSEVRFVPSPAGHLGSLMVLVDAMTHDGHTVFMDAWDPVQAVNICQRYQPYYMAAPAAFFTSLFEAERELGQTNPWPKYFGLGGAAVPAELVRHADETGRSGFRIYGSSEVPSVTSGGMDDSLRLRSETDGLPTLGARIEIVDDNDVSLSIGEEGEVWLQAPQMFSGYVDSSLDAEVITPEGWFRTGDLGRIGLDGTLTITGRKKDIIIRGGENISATEVEMVLNRHPSILEATVISLPDERLGERVCCVVRLQPGATLDLNDVRLHFREANLAIQKTPEQLVVWQEPFPRSAEGKIKKSEIRSLTLRELSEDGDPR